MNKPQTLDEILDTHAQEFKAGHLNKVRKAILEAVKEIIGEDEVSPKGWEFTSRDHLREPTLMKRNQLRAEQRAKAQEWGGK